jgi:hypothetical protein
VPDPVNVVERDHVFLVDRADVPVEHLNGHDYDALSPASGVPSRTESYRPVRRCRLEMGKRSINDWRSGIAMTESLTI